MNWGAYVRRLATNFGCHVVLFGIGFGTVWWLTSRPGVLRSDQLIALNSTQPDAIAFYIERASARLRSWWLVAATGSLVLSTLWLAFANRVQPAGSQHAASHKTPWFLYLIAFVIVGLGSAWWMLKRQAGAEMLSPGLVMNLSVFGLLAGGLFYWIATGVSVKPAMRASVPLANMLLR